MYFDFTKIIEAINNNNEFLIFSHINPDGDAIGSSLALYNVLKEMNKKVFVSNIDNFNEDYSFIDGFEKLIKIDSLEKRKYEVVFTLDIGDYKRVGIDDELFNYSDTIINIDHHVFSNSSFGKLNCLINSSSTAEIVYELIKAMKVNISKSVSNAILVGILTDTASLRLNVNPNAFRIVADLLENNVDYEFVIKNLYMSRSFGKIQLLNRIYSNLKFENNNKIAYSYLLKKDFDELNINEDKSEGMINEILGIENIEVAMILKECDENYKVSLRAKNDINVNEIASFYGGGGHKKAAGFHINKDNIEIKKNEILNLIKSKF